MRGSMEGRLGGKERREALKLALEHHMTNKGTALHHCRTPLEKKKKTNTKSR